MCGIAGIVSASLSNPEASSALKRMNNCIAHRGPDAEGFWDDGYVYFAHRRLSVIDLSGEGTQPLHSYDNKFTIVYNGELYNYKEMKLQLQRATQGSTEQPYFFKTQTDTEVILAAYIRWGEECLRRFNGMFAFAIYDKEKKELFIARDRLGIKPLYYTQTGNNLFFASEVRSILASGFVEKEIDNDSLIDYLRYQTVQAPQTILKNVKMLLPGHYAIFGAGELKIESWWKPEKNINYEAKDQSYETVCKNVKDLFYQSVERRLVADVPFGAFLSGGIDSSAVVGAMAEVSAQRVKTFSVVFNESDFSEERYSDIIAKKFNTEHHTIRLKPSDFLQQLPDALKAMDHPSGDGPNTYIVSKETRNAGVTMALSGLGSDELFAGYDIFKRSYELEKKWWLNVLPRLLVRLPAAEVVRQIKKTVSAQKTAEILIQPVIDFTSAYPVSRQLYLDKQVKKLSRREELPMNSAYRFLRLLDFNDKHYRLTKYSIAEISTYMQNVLLRDTDQMSMAVALEVRVPFLDYKLVEYVLGVPDKYKYPSTPKKLLTDSLKGLLPDEIIHRKKMGFVLPWQHWMKHELKSFCEENLAYLETIGIDKNEVNTFWNKFIKGDACLSWSRIWPLVTLGHWCRQNL